MAVGLGPAWSGRYIPPKYILHIYPPSHLWSLALPSNHLISFHFINLYCYLILIFDFLLMSSIWILVWSLPAHAEIKAGWNVHFLPFFPHFNSFHFFIVFSTDLLDPLLFFLSWSLFSWLVMPCGWMDCIERYNLVTIPFVPDGTSLLCLEAVVGGGWVCCFAFSWLWVGNCMGGRWCCVFST